MAQEPIARGVVVAQSERHGEPVGQLAREALSALRAMKVEAVAADAVPPEADFVLLLVDEAWRPDALALPDLKDRAASVLGVAEDAAEGRVAVTAARKHLRAHGAALGSREMVLTPARFDYVGLQSDGDRERLQILCQALVLDAERLRLRREGWEEPEA